MLEPHPVLQLVVVHLHKASYGVHKNIQLKGSINRDLFGRKIAIE